MNDRREWLARTLRTAAACALLPGAGLAPSGVRARAPAGRGAVRALGAALATSPRATRAGRRLVLLELGGANDGLNTLVPWRDERYRALRPTLSLRADELVRLDGMPGTVPGDAPALHGALAPLMPLVERGELAIVQGLGHPAPNRSHFASIRYWETGGDGRGGAGPDGWLTHDLEHRLGRPVADAHGIGLDGGVGPFDSATGRWLTTTSAGSLASLETPEPPGSPADASARGGVAGRPAVAAMAARMRDVHRTLGALQDKVRRAPRVESFGGGALGARLTDVARLIGAGLDVPVYHVRLPGFDTHERQRERHARLLGELAVALAALRDSLSASGEWERTLLMTYSEFGRRAAENGSAGTDHGTAARHLVAGGALGADALLHGAAPDLGALVDGDPVATLDYRALYERVLSGWFGIAGNRFAGFRDADALGGLFDAAQGAG